MVWLTWNSVRTQAATLIKEHPVGQLSAKSFPSHLSLPGQLTRHAVSELEPLQHPEVGSVRAGTVGPFQNSNVEFLPLSLVLVS